MEFPIRINKYLSEKGIATRRGADLLIEANEVFVNGKAAVIGQKINARDMVEFRGTPRQDLLYLVYYKPRGIITHSPGVGETDIASKLRENYEIEGVFPIGRLDKDSEGLMLLTNDGRVTERLLGPRLAHEREYRVTVDKRVTSAFIKELEHGVTIEGYATKPAKASKDAGNDRVFTITLTEGKKHQIRRMCAALGYQVSSLVRTRVSSLNIGKLKPGQYHKLTRSEQKEFLASLQL